MSGLQHQREGTPHLMGLIEGFQLAGSTQGASDSGTHRSHTPSGHSLHVRPDLNLATSTQLKSLKNGKGLGPILPSDSSKDWALSASKSFYGLPILHL